MNSDKITTLAGCIGGIALILSAFGVLTPDQSHAINSNAPLILAGLSMAIGGFYTNKK
jgi:hypothetical protein